MGPFQMDRRNPLVWPLALSLFPDYSTQSLHRANLPGAGFFCEERNLSNAP